ncbi:MAG: hypothetical protein Q9201_002140 [Fulgogasparrea decipioides]
MRLLCGLLPALITFGSPTLAAPTAGPFEVVKAAPKVLERASPDVVSPHVIELTRKPSAGLERSRYTKLLQKGDPVNGNVGLAILTPFKEILYFTNITFGTESFEAVVDTGSSDTWLAQKGFRCADVQTRVPLPEDQCHFGNLYTSSPTFKQIPGQNFNIRYGDGEALTGIVGTEDVTLAGITVKNQEIALINYAAWKGDNSSSGVIGLAFPGITSAFNGSDPAFDTAADELDYSPLFTSMYTQRRVAPVFSLAINRGEESGGLLALGGLPPVKHDEYFASTPIEQSVARPGNAAKPEYQYYTISVQGIKYGNTSEKAELRADVDSGTSLVFLPSKTASRINRLFDPPGRYDASTGEYAVDCKAKAPRFGILIGGHTFFVNRRDLIIKTQTGGCITGITNSILGRPAVLGDVFLKNVLAVFDVGASQMRFSGRELY